MADLKAGRNFQDPDSFALFGELIDVRAVLVGDKKGALPAQANPFRIKPERFVRMGFVECRSGPDKVVAGFIEQQRRGNQTRNNDRLLTGLDRKIEHMIAAFVTRAAVDRAAVGKQQVAIAFARVFNRRDPPQPVVRKTPWQRIGQTGLVGAITRKFAAANQSDVSRERLYRNGHAEQDQHRWQRS